MRFVLSSIKKIFGVHPSTEDRFEDWPEKVRASARRRLSHVLLPLNHEDEFKEQLQSYINQLYQDKTIAHKEPMIVDTADLIKEHAGHATVTARRILERAKGGVLVVREPYALSSSPSGMEGISTILFDTIGNLECDPVLILADKAQNIEKLISDSAFIQKNFESIGGHLPHSRSAAPRQNQSGKLR